MKKETITLKPTEIKPYEKNARKNDDAVPVVMESIKQCEYIAPIIVDEDNVILAGHTRYKALKKLKYNEIDVLRVSGLTDEQKRKYRLLDNKTNEIAQWDFELLPDELDGLDFGELELDWGITDEEEPKEVIEDDVPEVDEENEPITKLGDIWQLGEHRLMCGNSLIQSDIDKLLDGAKCELTFTDPPYQLETQGGGILKKANSMKQIRQNGVDEFDPLKLLLQSDTNIYCHNKPLIKKYIELAEINKLPYDLCFYKKLCTVPNYKGHLMTDCEYIAVIGKQDPNKGLEKETYSKCYIGKKDHDNELSYSKPVELCAKYIKLYAKKNVLDLFGGSGSTLIACEQLNRKCYTMELDPKYCDVIIKRWETLTSKKAEKINE
jgi:site-specific DNA-methyltransferase (adenine-specific)